MHIRRQPAELVFPGSNPGGPTIASRFRCIRVMMMMLFGNKSEFDVVMLKSGTKSAGEKTLLACQMRRNNLLARVLKECYSLLND